MTAADRLYLKRAVDRARRRSLAVWLEQERCYAKAALKRDWERRRRSR